MSDKLFRLDTCLAKTLASICAILFVVLIVLALPLNNILATTLDPNSYKRALEVQDLYGRLPSLIGEEIVFSMTYNPCVENPAGCAGENQGQPNQGDGLPNFMKTLTQKDWEVIMSNLVSKEWVKTQIEHLIDQIFAYLNSSQLTLVLKISLVDLKVNISGEAGVKAALQFLSAQPPCTEDQLIVLQQAFATGIKLENIPICRPSDQLINEFIPQLQQGLKQAAQSIPDEIDLAKPPQGASVNQPTKSPTQDFRPTLQRIQRWAQLTPVISAILLLLVGLFAVRSAKDFCRWWGLPILMAGIFLLGVSLLFMPLFSWLVNQALINGRLNFAGLTFNLVQIALDILRFLGKSIAQRTGFQAIALTCGGLVLLVISFLFPARKDYKAG